MRPGFCRVHGIIPYICPGFAQSAPSVMNEFFQTIFVNRPAGLLMLASVMAATFFIWNTWRQPRQMVRVPAQNRPRRTS